MDDIDYLSFYFRLQPKRIKMEMLSIITASSEHLDSSSIVNHIKFCTLEHIDIITVFLIHQLLQVMLEVAGC